MVFKYSVLALVLFFFPALSSGEVKRFDIPLEGSPSMGAEDAPVVIVEFLDYQ